MVDSSVVRLLDETEVKELCARFMSSGLMDRLETIALALPREIEVQRHRVPLKLDQFHHDIALLNELQLAGQLRRWLERAADLCPARPENEWLLECATRVGTRAERWRPKSINASGEHPDLKQARQRVAALRAIATEGDALKVARAELAAIKRSLRAQGRLQQGDILADRYVLSETLGEGGFASVWLALCEQTAQPFAVKVLHGQYNGDRTRIDRFRRGARMMRQLSKVPNVVNLVSDLAEDHGWHYFVMDYLKGGDFYRAVIKRRPALSHEKRIAAIIAIADAVDAAHQRGMVHRDIKPQNILLDGRDVAYLTDFDLVLADDTTGGTRTGAMGSATWAAPEQFDRPQDATPAADIFGLGMILLFAILGTDIPSHFRFQGKSQEVIDDLSAPDEIKSLIRECVEFEPSRRPASAHVFAARLRAAHARWKASDTAPDPGAYDEPIYDLRVARSIPIRTLSPKPGNAAKTAAVPPKTNIGATATPEPAQASELAAPAPAPQPPQVSELAALAPQPTQASELAAFAPQPTQASELAAPTVQPTQVSGLAKPAPAPQPAQVSRPAAPTPRPAQASALVEPAPAPPPTLRIAQRRGRSPRTLTILLGALLAALVTTLLVLPDADPSGDSERAAVQPVHVPPPIPVIDAGAADEVTHRGLAPEPPWEKPTPVRPKPTYAQKLSDAKRRLRGKNPARACKAYEELAREHPKKAEPLAGLGWCALEAKDYTAAMKHFDHALRVEQGDAWALFGRATALERGGQLEAAATAYEHYFNRHPTGEDASTVTNRLPGLRRQLKQREEQRDDCKREHPTDQPTELVLRGKCYTEKRKYDAAYAVLEQAIKQEPSFEPAHLWMARTAVITKDQTRVERACAAFHALAPSKPCPGP